MRARGFRPANSRHTHERPYGRLIDILTGRPQAMIVVSHDPHCRRTIGTRGVSLREGLMSTLDEASRVDSRILRRSF